MRRGTAIWYDLDEKRGLADENKKLKNQFKKEEIIKHQRKFVFVY